MENVRPTLPKEEKQAFMLQRMEKIIEGLLADPENVKTIKQDVKSGSSLRKATAQILCDVASKINVSSGNLKHAENMRVERMRNFAQELQVDQLSIKSPRTSFPRLWPSLEEQMGSDFRLPAQLILQFEKLRQSKTFQLRVRLLKILGGKLIAPPQETKKLEEFQLFKQDPTGLSYLDKVSETLKSPSYNLGVSAYKTLYQAAVLAGIPKDAKF